MVALPTSTLQQAAESGRESYQEVVGSQVRRFIIGCFFSGPCFVEATSTSLPLADQRSALTLACGVWAEGTIEGRKQNRNKSKSLKIREIKDKVVNKEAGDSDDALVCCIENTVEDRIMDSGASFHATYCKEELERFKLRSGKVRLADDKTLDIVGVGNVILKTSFSTSWTLKDVRCFGEAEESFLHNVREDKETIEVRASSYRRLDPATMILLSKTAAGVVVGIMQTFRAESTRLRAEAPKMLWADSVSTAYLIYRIPYVPIGLRIPEEEWRGKYTSLAHLKLSRYEESPGYP
ncbi:hypothetical protein Tco_1246053 [Tanacetum coccineum]